MKARRKLPSDLPDRVRDVILPTLEPDEGRLAQIGQIIAARRDEAVNGRKASGIEDTWLACEEAYNGIDDGNRHEYGGRWTKGMSMDAPITRNEPGKASEQSTVFVRLTARYVDAGHAKLAEILLPLDGKSFSIKPTPIPDLIKLKQDTSQVVSEIDGQMVPLTRPARPNEVAAQPAPPSQPVPSPVAAPAAPGATIPGAAAPSNVPPGSNVLPFPGAPPPGEVPLTVKDVAEEQEQMAADAAKKAEKRIHDWRVEAKSTSHIRQVIFDSARLGVGVLKGPIPKVTRGTALKKVANGVELHIREQIKPGEEWIDPWNFYPDPNCGECIHNGNYVFERDPMPEWQVRKLAKSPGYIARQIDLVLEEGPKGYTPKDDRIDPKRDPNRPPFEVWHHYGVLSREEMECICQHAGTPLLSKDVPRSKPVVFVIVTLINDRVVRAVFNPLESGSFPYHVKPWQRRNSHWAGIGIAEQVSTPQRMINAATRAMLDNAGLSAGAQIVVDHEGIRPVDGNWKLVPRKIWLRTGDSNMTVPNSFAIFEIPNVTPQMLEIIQYALRLAEESTSIPLITQGQSGPTTPNTYGATQLQNNNANQLLRSIGYSFDDDITEPLVKQYYEWLLLDPDVPDDEKGDFQIEAKGSVALVEQAIHDETIVQLGQMVANPVYELNPAKWAQQFLKTKRLDPREFKDTPEEAAAKAQNAQPQVDPRIESAKIQAQSRVEVAKLEAHASQEEVVAELQVDLKTLELKRELALLEYANREKIALDQAKKDLAKTAMTLDVQQKLSGQPPSKGKQPADKSGKQPQGQPAAQGETGTMDRLAESLKALADAIGADTEVTTSNGKTLRARRVPRAAPAPQVATPAAEPPGRARPGRAFVQ